MFNVGDKLIIKCKATITCEFKVVDRMKDYCNKRVTIKEIEWSDYRNCNDIYLVEDGPYYFSWSDDSFIGKVGEITIQPDIAIICKSNKEILKVLSELLSSYRLGMGSYEEAIAKAEIGMFLVNSDSFEFDTICSDYSSMYTYVEYADMLHNHDEKELRTKNNCPYLYNELLHCGSLASCAKCTL